MNTSVVRMIALCAAIAANSLAIQAGAQESSESEVSRAYFAQSCDGAFHDDTADAETVRLALNDANQGGFAGLEKHLADLEAVMARAPACYPMFEVRGDTVIARADEPASAVILAVLVEAAVDKRNASVVSGDNVYPNAALLLALDAVENGRYQEGLAWSERGLLMQPHHASLIYEKAAALFGMQRYQDVIDTFQAALDDEVLNLIGYDRARALRGIGIALVDLGRLVEAEEALQASISENSDNPIAYQELNYIAQLRAGAAARPSVVGRASTPE